VLSEAVRNALKHAEPTHVGVSWGPQDGAFVLQVTNNGVEGDRSHHGGMGLRLAAFEALQLGGVLDFGPVASGCWQVRLVVPYEHA
jgi:signal transduction histidine kinase